MRSSVPLYDSLADDYDNHFEVPHRWAYDELSWHAVVDALDDPDPDHPVLDAGCGVGRWAERFIGIGHSVVGIEQSPRMAAAARSRGLGPRFTLVEGSMEDSCPPVMPLAAVVAMGSLQYTRDPAATLERFRRWTAPGGIVAVLVDSLGALVAELVRDGRHDEAEQRRSSRRGVWTAGDEAADLHLFDSRSLAAAMTAAGLVDVEVRGLLVGWTLRGPGPLIDDIRAQPTATLERETTWSTDGALVDMGKQLLGIGRVPA